MNIQFAIKSVEGRHLVYVLEVNPRASRTVPFVSKATGRPLAKIAAKVMAGVSLADQGVTDEMLQSRTSHLGPRKRVSLFAVPGVDINFGTARSRSNRRRSWDREKFSPGLCKSQIAAASRFRRREPFLSA